MLVLSGASGRKLKFSHRKFNRKALILIDVGKVDYVAAF